MQKNILLVGTEERLPLYQEAAENPEIEFRVVGNLHATLEAIKEKIPSLIMVDHEALGSLSLDIAHTLKKYPGTQRLPLIFIISQNNQEPLLDALDIPINDYLFLPLDTEDFKLRIKTQLELLSLKEKRKLISVKEKVEELEKLLEIFPEYNAARQELSAIYEKTGQIEKAMDSNLQLAKEYYKQNNFGLAMDEITKIKNIIAQQSIQFASQAPLIEALDRCIQMLVIVK